MDIGDLRRPYNDTKQVFLEEHIEKKEPFDLFHKWFELVKNDPRTAEPNAVCLSTCSKDGYPSGRMVLLKGYGQEGFTFFTHYTSSKGKELEENNKAALTFYWEHFNRQVRVEGEVQKLPFAEADEYFRRRPYKSQIGSLCSDQSKPVASRDVLIAKADELRGKYKENEVPRPPQWGGYLLKPKSVEFWQGQTDRIHDRIRFRYPKEGEPDEVLTKQGLGRWIYERLCP